jgi:hypothetical protein
MRSDDAHEPRARAEGAAAGRRRDLPVEAAPDRDGRVMAGPGAIASGLGTTGTGAAGAALSPDGRAR